MLFLQAPAQSFSRECWSYHHRASLNNIHRVGYRHEGRGGLSVQRLHLPADRESAGRRHAVPTPLDGVRTSPLWPASMHRAPLNSIHRASINSMHRARVGGGGGGGTSFCWCVHMPLFQTCPRVVSTCGFHVWYRHSRTPLTTSCVRSYPQQVPRGAREHVLQSGALPHRMQASSSGRAHHQPSPVCRRDRYAVTGADVRAE
jgi:hypothetical protein